MWIFDGPVGCTSGRTAQQSGPVGCTKDRAGWLQIRTGCTTEWAGRLQKRAGRSVPGRIALKIITLASFRRSSRYTKWRTVRCKGLGSSTTAWGKGLVKCHMSASQVLNALTYWTTMAPNDALQEPNVCNHCKPCKLIAINVLLKTFTQFMDARKSRFAPNTPDPLCA